VHNRLVPVFTKIYENMITSTLFFELDFFLLLT